MVSNLNPTKSCPQEARLHVVEMGARRLSGTIEALRQRDATCLVHICLAFVFVFLFVWSQFVLYSYLSDQNLSCICICMISICLVFV